MAKPFKQIQKQATTVLISLSLVGSPLLAQADINSDMADMFNNMGANTSYTQSGAYYSQSSGMYTGGGVSARWGNKTITPFEIQLPSVTSGCGGIDFFSGAFSFANKEQFVQFVRNLGNNAAGVAFDIALDALDPLVGGAISKIRALVNNVNNFNMNSCQIARQTLYGAYGRMITSGQKECEAKLVERGKASDGAEAAWMCKQPGEIVKEKWQSLTDALASQSGGQPATIKAPVEFTGGNVTLMALNKFNISDEEKRWLLSMLGSMVAPAPDKSKPDEPPKIQYIPPTISKVDDIVNFVGVNSTNRTVKIALLKCYEPASPGTISFNEIKATQCKPEDVNYTSLKAMIQANVTNLKTSIANGTSIPNSDSVIRLIENSQLPILKLAIMDVANKGSGTLSDVAIDAITYQIATKYLNGLLMYGEEALGKYVTQSDEDRQQIELAMKNIREARDRIDRDNKEAYRKALDGLAYADYIQKVNEQFKTAFPQMQSSINLSSLFTKGIN